MGSDASIPNKKRRKGRIIGLSLLILGVILVLAVVVFWLIRGRQEPVVYVKLTQPQESTITDSAPTQMPTQELTEPTQPPREQIYQVPEVRFYNSKSKNMNKYVGVTVKIIDVYGDVVLEDEQCQWRVHGNSTARVAKKPYKFKLSSEQDLFGMGAARKWILLANAFDKTLIRNKLVFDLAATMEIPYTSKSTFVEVYVDDSYRGSYLLIEPAEVDKERVDLRVSQNEFLLELEQAYRTTDVPIIKTPHLKIPLGVSNIDYLPEDQRLYLMDLFDKAETALLSHDRQQIQQYFDLDTFLDMYIINEYSKNSDTHIASTRFYVEDGIIHAGPPWDYDLSCGNDNEDSDYRHRWNGTRPSRTSGMYACSLWWSELYKCDWFKTEFAQRYLELQPVIVNLYEENELGESRIQYLTSSISDSIAHNFTKWSVSIRIYRLERIADRTYKENLQFLQNWLKKRNEWILGEIEKKGW